MLKFLIWAQNFVGLFTSAIIKKQNKVKILYIEYSNK